MKERDTYKTRHWSERNAWCWFYAGRDLWRGPDAWCVGVVLLPSPEYMTRANDLGRVVLCALAITFIWPRDWAGRRWRVRSDAAEITQRLANGETQ